MDADWNDSADHAYIGANQGKFKRMVIYGKELSASEILKLDDYLENGL